MEEWIKMSGQHYKRLIIMGYIGYVDARVDETNYSTDLREAIAFSQMHFMK